MKLPSPIPGMVVVDPASPICMPGIVVIVVRGRAGHRAMPVIDAVLLVEPMFIAPMVELVDDEPVVIGPMPIDPPVVEPSTHDPMPLWPAARGLTPWRVHAGHLGWRHGHRRAGRRGDDHHQGAERGRHRAPAHRLVERAVGQVERAGGGEHLERGATARRGSPHASGCHGSGPIGSPEVRDQK